MKKFIYSIMAFAAISFASVSCVQEELHQKGEPDAEGCYGVYFPAQESALTLDPAEPLTATVAVVRTVSTGDITVPVKLTDKTGIFVISELKFEDGQTESTIEVTFENAEVGVAYACALAIEDPQYASKYSNNPVYLDFSVVREKWTDLGKGTYVDDGAPWTQTITKEVTILQNDNNKNLFRIVMKDASDPENVWAVYSENNPVNLDITVLKKGDVIEVDNDPFMPIEEEVKVTEDDVVYYKPYSTGLLDGDEVLYLYHAVAFGRPLTYNKVLQYQENGLPAGIQLAPMFVFMPSFSGWDNAQQDGVITITFPGAVLTDYSIKINTGLAEDGALPVQFVLGADVASAKYAVYEGQLNSAQKQKFAEAIAAGTETAAKDVPEGGVFSVTMEETGVYTIIGVTFDAEGVAQASEVAEFSYVAQGDTKPVVVGAGLAATDKYAPLGFTAENSLEFYVYGEELTSVKIGLFTYVELVADVQACFEEVAESEPVDAETLELINGDGYVDVISKLSPGTQYGLLVIASNGYEQTEVLKLATTEGDPLPVYMNYSAADIKDELLPATSEGYFGTYNYYAVDAYGELGMREYIGQVTISDSDTPDLGPDPDGLTDEFVNIKGFFGMEAQVLGLDDTMEWDYCGGVLFSLGTSGVMGESKLEQIPGFIAIRPALSDGRFATMDYVLLGGYVADGYIAFVDNDTPYGFSGLMMVLYGDEGYAQALEAISWYQDILLVDPAKDDNGLAPAPEAPAVAAKKLQLGGLKKEISEAPMNYVETPKGRIRSIIDKYNSTPRNYAGNVAGLENAEREVKAAEFTVGSAEPFAVQNTSEVMKTKLDRLF